jgi:biotin carboxylase
MDKVLVVPAGVYQIPAILKAKEIGLKVITADNRPQNPGHKYADRSEFISTIDKDDILSLAKEENINAIFTMASDIALKTVNYVTRELGLIENLSDEVVETTCLKNRFRNFQKRYNFNHPDFRIVDDYSSFRSALKELDFPLFIKPSDNSGSKGVYYIDNDIASSCDLQRVFATAMSFSRNNIVCIEKKLEGMEIGGDALIINGKIAFCALTNKYITPHPSYIPIGHSMPSLLSDDVKKQVIESLQLAVSALNIECSPLNFDIIVGSDSISILEMSPRLGGNCIPAIVQLGTGYDMVEAALQISLGVTPKVPESIELKPTGVRILRSNHDGILVSYSNLEEFKNKRRKLLEIIMDYTPGSAIKCYSQGADRIGHLICQSTSVAELEQELDLIEKDLNISVKA